MTFSNPAATAAASAKSYVRALLELLGDRRPLDVLPELTPWLAARLRGIPESVLRRPETPGKCYRASTRTGGPRSSAIGNPQ